MANYTVNISQAVANQEEALKLNSTTPDTLGSIFSSFFVIHSQLTNAYSYAPTYSSSATSIALLWTNGVTKTYAGTTSPQYTSATESNGTALASSIVLYIPGSLRETVAGNFPFDYTVSNSALSFAPNAASTLNSYKVELLSSTASPIFGKETLQFSGSLVFDTNNNFSGTVSSIRVSAEKFLASEVITGNFYISGNASQIGAGTSSIVLTGVITGKTSTFVDGSVSTISGLPGVPVTGSTVFDYPLLNSALSLGANVIDFQLPASYYENVPLVSGAGNDVIHISGGGGRLTLDAGAGNDTISGGASNDVINGGAGVDTVIFTGNRSSYSFSGTVANFTVTDLRVGSPDGTDALSNVESLRFADSTYSTASLFEPTYNLTATPASANEGGAVTYTVTTTNVAANTVLNYTLSGTGITTADIGGASLTGTTTVAANGTASFTVNLTADQLTEGAETLTATVQGQIASVTVNDTSTTPVVTGRTKYFVLPSSTGANFTDFDLSFGSVTLAGEQVTFVGSSAVDALFVRPGMTVDFTLSGSGADKIYLGGNYASYAASIAGSVMTLQRGSGATFESVSFIKSTSAASSDSVIFADGTLNSLDLYNNLKTAAALPALSTAETSIAPLAPALAGSVLNASIKAFALNAGGDTFAPAKPGVAMTVVGSLGVDTVYVGRGGVEDCTLLGSGQDLIYFTGNWADYTKAISGSVLTFSRTVDGYNESVKVVGSATNISLNDRLVFADGAVYSGNAKTALSASLTTAVNAVTGYDATLVTPGVGTSLMPNALNGVTDLEVGSNIVLNYSANVSAVAGKYIHIVNDGGTGFHGEATVNTLNILVTDTTQVSIVGGKVTLNPTADLDLANNYHITIDAGAFTTTATGVALPAYDGTSALHFSTVTPGTTALANAVVSHIMNADGTLGSGHLWLDIEGIGSAVASTALDLSGNNYSLVAKDYSAPGGSTGNDGVTTGDFNVAASNFGGGDLLYIDNQGGAANDLTQTIIINRGTPPSTVQFAGTNLGGFVDISLAGTTTPFETIALMKTLLGTATSPVISA